MKLKNAWSFISPTCVAVPCLIDHRDQVTCCHGYVINTNIELFFLINGTPTSGGLPAESRVLCYDSLTMKATIKLCGHAKSNPVEGIRSIQSRASFLLSVAFSLSYTYIVWKTDCSVFVFMRTYIVNQCQQLCNKLRLYTVYYISVNCSTCFGWTPPIIRSTYNCNYSICHWSNRLCYLLLWWCVPTVPPQQKVAETVWPVPDAVTAVIFAPDDGWSYHPKHVEQFTEI
jgi:hypothetical protein